MAKVVVTGASGLLGRALYQTFKEEGFTVTGFAKSRVSAGLLSVDLLDSDELRARLRQLAPQVIVHSAAYRSPDQVEADAAAARRMNVHASQVIAEVAAELGAQLLYISTDYVFDGCSPPYKADDPPNPLNLYGQTKLEGERATLHACPGALVLRVPVLYGPVERLDESAVTVLLRCLLEPPAAGCAVSDLEKRYPAHVRDVADICHRLLEKQREDRAVVRGVYQWSGSETLTKYGMVRAMAAVFGLSAEHVTPVRAPPPAGTRRPLDSRLDTGRLAELGIGTHTPFAEGIEQCLSAWLEKKDAPQ
ncbi:methionine adenosyltransferase 2 subunit beta-like [Amphibalanus amphitrite]|uniref:methionine adenosyltransferase 2 subunit beta-like n=1 Tax=Amphibalanus amphitrite TaxID=1232801 RepID=UPI001C920355|nr:methionine adenosyltransferase 2 subunit beta-like [Amphibalanus amphitrite]